MVCVSSQDGRAPQGRIRHRRVLRRVGGAGTQAEDASRSARHARPIVGVVPELTYLCRSRVCHPAGLFAHDESAQAAARHAGCRVDAAVHRRACGIELPRSMVADRPTTSWPSCRSPASTAKNMALSPTTRSKASSVCGEIVVCQPRIAPGLKKSAAWF